MDIVSPKQSINTADAGPDKRILRKLWENATFAEAQLELISRLVELNLGLPDIEEFLKTQHGKLKSDKFKFNNVNSKQVNILMKSKLGDAEEKYRQAKKAKVSMRKDLDRLYGINSRRCKNVLRKLGKEMRKLKSNIREE